MGKEKYICPCFKVTCDDIRKAVEDGADSFKKVKKATKVSGKCGHCECRVKTFTKEMLKDMGKETSIDTSQGNKKSEGKKNVSKKNEEKKIEGKVKAGQKTADRNKEDKKIEGKFKTGNKKSDKDKKLSKTKGKNKEGKIKQGKIKQGKEKKDKKKAGKNLKGESHNPLKMKVIKLDDKNYKVKNIK